MKKIKVECVDRLTVLLSRPKRIKLLVGGRASTKSTFVGDRCVAGLAAGEVWCCSREYQNSIDDSVHSLLKDEVERLRIPGFEVLRSEINHASGGRAFYRGLARNITSLKGIYCDYLWIEEGESCSKDTLKVLTASVRVSAKEQQKAKENNRDIKFPEIWITMNRGSSKDPIAKQYLQRAEKDLAKCGYYEDDLMIAIELNYDENPWFESSGLEQERVDDKKHLSRAAYDHKWHGAYSDTIENAIIEPEWFDRCIDAHEQLGFKSEGMQVVTYDPSDGGDAAGIAHRHGVVFVEAKEIIGKKANDGCDVALDYANSVRTDVFCWDSGGLGLGLKRQITDAFDKTRVILASFEGQAQVRNPESLYQPTLGVVMQAKKNREAFINRRAQAYWLLRDRIFYTYMAITTGKFTDPENLISFSSKITDLSVLRSELCRISRKEHAAGKIKILSKPEMKKEGVSSPNLADCVMMSLDVDFFPNKKTSPIVFSGWGGN